MTDHYLPSVKSDDQAQSSSHVETFTFRVEPSSVPVFITKLCLMLDNNALGEMISWSNDGKRFCVFDIPGFSKMVLPQYFKHNNWPSFVRQLNMYGFHKMNDSFSARHGQQICEFHHPLFYRNGRLALRNIRRNSRKSVSNTVVPQALHQSQHSSLQHQQLHLQHHQQRRHKRQCQTSSSPSCQPESSVTSTSIPTSSMPISSLLSSKDNDYTDDNTISFLGLTTNNDTIDVVMKDDNRHFIDSKHRIISGSSNRSTIGSNNSAFDIDNKSSTDTSININTHFGHGIKKNKGKRVADIRYDYDYGDSQDNKTDGSNSITSLAQQYTEIHQHMIQLQSSTAYLNSEMSFLKRYVAKQQESVVDFLNYSSTIMEDPEDTGCKNQQQHQEALKALQARGEGLLDASHGKSRNTSDNENACLHHHHHHYYHHYHLSNHQVDNGNFDGLDDARYFDDHNDKNNPTKKETSNTLHKPKQSTEPAKKDHHMHIHPLDNNESTTLDNNKHDNHGGPQSNSNCSDNDDHRSNTATPTAAELISPTISHAPEKG